MTMIRPRLVLFDPFAGGHHTDHLCWLASAWLERDVAGTLLIAASPRLIDESADLGALVRSSASGSVAAVALEGTSVFEHPISLAKSTWHHWRLLRNFLRMYSPEQIMAMYLDHAQVAFAMRRRLGSTRFSGLLFRPELHLPLPTGALPRLKRLRKKWLLQAMAASPTFDVLFTLDPTAVASLQAAAPTTRVQAVPDPAPIEENFDPPEVVRTRYGVEPNRVLFVLPGALEERKGVFATLDAIERLPDHVARKLSVVFAGSPVPGTRERLESSLERVRGVSNAQIIFDDRFLPGSELQAAISAADVVLAPYQGHIGSSGIIMRAAAAGQAVIAQAEGLVGWQVQHHRLGWAVPGGDIDALRTTLTEAVAWSSSIPDGTQPGFDEAAARAFASGHTIDAYTSAILDRLLAPCPRSRRGT